MRLAERWAAERWVGGRLNVERGGARTEARGLFGTGLLRFASLRAAFGRLSSFGRLTGIFWD